MGRPDKLRIPYEDFEYARFDCVGRLPDGTQFMGFATGAFPTGREFDISDGWRLRKRWLAVLHRFDADGDHIGSESRLGGFDIEGRQTAGDKAFAHLDQMFAELFMLRSPQFCDIWVRQFSIEIGGVTHGLFYQQSDEDPEPNEERSDWVMLLPNDIMFHPPWDSGNYST